METRKLQRVGGGTYTVSIPKAWATDHGLETGATVHLYTHLDGSIVVRSSKKDGDNLNTARIEIDGRDPVDVERSLKAAYVIGFDTISLVQDEPLTDGQRRAVRSTVRKFTGAEISEETDSEISIHNLLNTSDVSVRQSVVQLQFVSLSMYQRAVEAAIQGDTETHEQFVERNEETDRLFAMLSRHFHRSMVSFEELDRLDITRTELFEYYVTAQQLEKVADRSVTIARLGTLLSGPLPERIADDIRTIGDSINRIVDDATTGVLDRSGIEQAHRTLDRSAEAFAEIDTLQESLLDGTIVLDESGTDTLVVARVLDNLVRTVGYGETIAEVALRAMTRDENL